MSFWLFWIVTVPGVLLANQGSLLENYDESSVRAVLAEEVPSLTVDSVTFFSTGWDNLVADINGGWVFRFPRLAEYVDVLDRETILLNRLQERVSMPVPKYEYKGSNTVFVGYHKIEGEPITAEEYLALPPEVRQQIAESLALFLTQFHNAVTAEEAFAWGYKEHRIPIAWIEDSLLGTLPSPEAERIIREAIAYIKENPYTKDHLVLLHNDIHGENVAFNTKTHKITGVFDFSDAAVGDYSTEFGTLFTIDLDLVRRTGEVYARLNQVPNPTVPAAAEFIVRRAKYILRSRELGESEREADLVKLLEKFAPVWDQL